MAKPKFTCPRCAGDRVCFQTRYAIVYYDIVDTTETHTELSAPEITGGVPGMCVCRNCDTPIGVPITTKPITTAAELHDYLTRLCMIETPDAE